VCVGWLVVEGDFDVRVLTDDCEGSTLQQPIISWGKKKSVLYSKMKIFTVP
jgi:hypothetical protein